MATDDGGTANSPLERLFAPSAVDGRPTLPVLGATITPWVLDLIRRFRAAGPTMRVCAHLADDADQGALWRASIPDLRSCRRAACTDAVLAVLAERLGHPPEDEPPRCTSCGRAGVVIRGVGVAVGPAMLRGTVCDDCFAARPIATPASATDPVTVATHGPRRPLELDDDEPLAVDREELADTETRVPFDAAGRRALRRGWLLAEACCKATATPLTPDQAVVGGLLVRAAKLAKGLAAAPPADGAFVHALAFRSLAETTTTLWGILRADASDGATATAAFRDSGSAGLVAGTVEPPGSWRELTTLHLAEHPDGFALDLGQRDPDPLQALIAGEHLSLACADYVDRMTTDLDPDQLRRLADEVTELRASVEAALTERGDA